jgi:hypothetical protein
MDWRYASTYPNSCGDYECDEYHNFTSRGIDFFNDDLTSFRWCGLDGATLTIYDDSNFDTGGDGTLACEGDGDIAYSSNVGAYTPFDCTRSTTNNFDNEASGVNITWSGSSGVNEWVCLNCPGGVLTTRNSHREAFFYATPGLPSSVNTIKVTYRGKSKTITIRVQSPIYLPLVIR